MNQEPAFPAPSGSRQHVAAEWTSLGHADCATGSAAASATSSDRQIGTSLGAEKPNRTLLPWTARTVMATSGPILMLSPGLRLKTNMASPLRAEGLDPRAAPAPSGSVGPGGAPTHRSVAEATGVPRAAMDRHVPKPVASSALASSRIAEKCGAGARMPAPAVAKRYMRVPQDRGKEVFCRRRVPQRDRRKGWRRRVVNAAPCDAETVHSLTALMEIVSPRPVPSCRIRA